MKRFHVTGVILRPMHPDELDPKKVGFWQAISIENSEKREWGRNVLGITELVRQRVTNLALPATAIQTEEEFWKAVEALAQEKLKPYRKIVPFKKP